MRLDRFLSMMRGYPRGGRPSGPRGRGGFFVNGLPERECGAAD
jgi:hypothetical protein